MPDKQPTAKEGRKMLNGVSFVAPPKPISIEGMAPIAQSNANWVAIIPYAFSVPGQTFVNYNYIHQWWGERREGAAKTIKFAHDLGYQVMLKPHVWVRGQGWPGDFTLEGEAAWKDWEKSYHAYIMAYAQIADSMKVEMLCIGTEFRTPARERPDFWYKLIKDVKSVYQGKLTYAANWDNYHLVNFWDALDYIGVDAYFPLPADKTPSVRNLGKQWQKDKQQLFEMGNKWQKPIIFTEYGYRSIDYNTDGHWKYDEDTLQVNLTAQANAYEAIYQEFWHEPWFEGGFLWKWHANGFHHGGPECKRFTPQEKPAMKVIQDWYGKSE